MSPRSRRVIAPNVAVNALPNVVYTRQDAHSEGSRAATGSSLMDATYGMASEP